MWEFELDESYFGAHRVRDKRGLGAVGKTPIFGLSCLLVLVFRRGEAGKTLVFGPLKRNGKVFSTVVSNCSRKELMLIIQGEILFREKFSKDQQFTLMDRKAYDGLISNSYNYYYRLLGLLRKSKVVFLKI